MNLRRMNLGVIVQARMSSTRLPGKILKDFYRGHTLLDIILQKLHRIPDAVVVVATSTNEADDALATYLEAKGERVYRGSENDVLQRFIGAAEENGIDGIVRICSDNPFLDVDGLCQLAQVARGNAGADYIGFRVNGKPSILTHFGFWGEYVTLDALKRVAATTDEKPAHEHVTNYIYTHDGFCCAWIAAPEFLEGRTDIRLTIDTPVDFENAQIIYESLTAHDGDFSLQQVVECLAQHQEIVERMNEVIIHNTK